MRHIFFTVKLYLEGRLQTVPPRQHLITIGTPYIESIEGLVEKNKPIYLASGYNIARFEIIDTRYSVMLTEQEYQEQVSYCDIVDEPDSEAIGPSVLIKSIHQRGYEN